MPKFENLTEAFWYISEHPTEYLPEKSLALFEPFWWGYERRYRLAFPDEKAFDLLDGFHDFVAFKYLKSTSTRGAAGIVRIYSRNEAEAYGRWFANLNEFTEGTGVSRKRLEQVEEIKTYLKVQGDTRNKTPGPELEDFFGFLKLILRRPKMYAGNGQTFTLIVSLISGWLFATQDFDLEKSEQENIFEDLTRYISEKAFWLRPLKDSGLPPPPHWKNVLLAQYQTEDEALDAFTLYIDEYAFQGKRSVAEVEYRWGLES